MTVSKTDTPAYTDLNGLSALKRGAANHDPATIRKVAQQFESLFTRMMLKSMRDASGKDPMFGSDQSEMYQSMADDQLSVQLSKGKGIGLADMLVRQLQKMGVKGARATPSAEGTDASSNARNPTNTGFAITPGGSTSHSTGAAAYRATQRAAARAPVSDAAKSSFVQGLWPQAEQAGRQLGVDPRHLIAQAALETHWGQNLPQSAAGAGSHNLFGIKAAAGWTGAAVSSGTREFQGGVASNTTSRFRAYSTADQSFQDYVALLRDNPRYSAALNTGSDVHAFAAGLQRGGYATDPDYATKIAAVARRVDGALANAGVTDLKLSSGGPITAGTETL